MLNHLLLVVFQTSALCKTKITTEALQHMILYLDLSWSPYSSDAAPFLPELIDCSFGSLNRNGGGGTMAISYWISPHGQWLLKLTMTMTPRNLPMVNSPNGPILTI